VDSGVMEMKGEAKIRLPFWNMTMKALHRWLLRPVIGDVELLMEILNLNVRFNGI